MSESDQDDQPTVIIDFNTVKDELQSDELLTDEESEELFDLNIDEPLSLKLDKNIYYFDYESSYFKEKSEQFTNISKANILGGLKELNHILTTDPTAVIAFYYNDHPKVVNQLSSQIKKKFTQTSTLIIAKGLSPAKAEQHAKSKYGATAYLKEPFDKTQLENTLNNLKK